MARRRPPAHVTRHRFFLPPDAFVDGHVCFPAGTSHQIARVLRLRPGDRVVALDGSGREYVARLTDTGPPATGEIETSRPNLAEPPRPIELYQGMLKATKLETVIQRCVEVGATRIVPVLTERCVPAELGAARWQRFQTIAREAAEQSRRGIIPAVAHPLAFSAAIREATTAGPTLLLYENAAGGRLDRIPPLRAGGPIALFVGPEGGFDGAEVALARDLGANILSLGPRILRAETAAVVACAVVGMMVDTFSGPDL